MKIFLIITLLVLVSACSSTPFSSKEKPVIHAGHFLKSEMTKEANEEILRTLENKNYSLINLTLSDLLIAKSKGINFENYPRLIFLNSSIIDLEKDALFSASNIVSNYILNGTCFIGLSDSQFDRKLSSEHYLIDDYVLSILKVKHDTKRWNPTSYVLIHVPGKDFEEIPKRLPEDFRALLTD